MSKLGDEDQVSKARRKTRMQEVGIEHEHLTLKDSLIFSRRRGGIEGENQVRRRESEGDHEILISRMRNSGSIIISNPTKTYSQNGIAQSITTQALAMKMI